MFFLLIELLKVVSYFDIIQTLIGRSGSDRIILANFGKHFWESASKMSLFFLETFENLTDGSHLQGNGGIHLSADAPVGREIQN